MRVNTQAVRYWLFVILVIVALLLGTSSLLLWVLYPRGYFSSRLLWTDIHKWAGLALYVAVVLHVALHWRWLVHMTRRYLSRLAHIARRRN